ncbi:hypothetical protein D2962_16725 [Biomaibacter acetigenes]|jgi:hypothetical protein|uniref:Prenylated flavin chaperone LpdD-like domain-containing protein n=1 Tax=Biomaibacter acetigenes TaxID=2316383 RepID=A0A3G2R978_9FIRM|nr:proteasome assembly chaperone 4 family protein [Biomaibacter acetigenes]AYO32021.1 hypothetical protein D2962_16725 [Biomaibacter acetigenes]
MNHVFIEKAGEGKFYLEAVITVTQEGINIYLGGGEKPHIGSVAVSQPRPSLKGDGSISCTTSVLNLLGHKDDGLAVPLAEKLCKKLKQTVVVTAGVHIDNATMDDIQRFKDNCKILCENIVKHFCLM